MVDTANSGFRFEFLDPRTAFVRLPEKAAEHLCDYHEGNWLDRIADANNVRIRLTRGADERRGQFVLIDVDRRLPDYSQSAIIRVVAAMFEEAKRYLKDNPFDAPDEDSDIDNLREPHSHVLEVPRNITKSLFEGHRSRPSEARTIELLTKAKLETEGKGSTHIRIKDASEEAIDRVIRHIADFDAEKRVIWDAEMLCSTATGIWIRREPPGVERSAATSSEHELDAISNPGDGAPTIDLPRHVFYTRLVRGQLWWFSIHPGDRACPTIGVGSLSDQSSGAYDMVVVELPFVAAPRRWNCRATVTVRQADCNHEADTAEHSGQLRTPTLTLSSSDHTVADPPIALPLTVERRTLGGDAAEADRQSLDAIQGDVRRAFPPLAQNVSPKGTQSSRFGIDLTGHWTSDSSSSPYFVTQLDDAVAWLGVSSHGKWANVAFGHLCSGRESGYSVPPDSIVLCLQYTDVPLMPSAGFYTKGLVIKVDAGGQLMTRSGDLDGESFGCRVWRRRQAVSTPDLVDVVSEAFEAQTFEDRQSQYSSSSSRLSSIASSTATGMIALIPTYHSYQRMSERGISLLDQQRARRSKSSLFRDPRTKAWIANNGSTVICMTHDGRVKSTWKATFDRLNLDDGYFTGVWTAIDGSRLWLSHSGCDVLALGEFCFAAGASKPLYVVAFARRSQDDDSLQPIHFNWCEVPYLVSDDVASWTPTTGDLQLRASPDLQTFTDQHGQIWHRSPLSLDRSVTRLCPLPSAAKVPIGERAQLDIPVGPVPASDAISGVYVQADARHPFVMYVGFVPGRPHDSSTGDVFVMQKKRSFSEFRHTLVGYGRLSQSGHADYVTACVPLYTALTRLWIYSTDLHFDGRGTASLLKNGERLHFRKIE